MKTDYLTALDEQHIKGVRIPGYRGTWLYMKED